MTAGATSPLTIRKPLRLWPGVLTAVLLWSIWYVLPFLSSNVMVGYAAVLGGTALGLIIVLWWLFFSRAAWSERLGAVALMIVAGYASTFIIDESVATAGQGMMYAFYLIPTLTIAFVAWAALTRNLPDRVRRVTMAATILLVCGAWGLVRFVGVHATGSHFEFRLAPTAEERLLATAGDDPATPTTAAATAGTAEWPGFRGSNRDGSVYAAHIETDWKASPPIEIWRKPVGPGWSSFAVHGDRIYTQEQRGEDEVVSCYDAATGEAIWLHRDKARFWEANGGAGPRGTPTLANGRVYTFGGTGIVNVLEASDGSVVWSRNASEDTGVEIPYWGFSASPLVVDEVVVVAAERQLVGYDAATGARLWSGPVGGASHSSPHLMTVDGVSQVVHLHGDGAVGVSPSDGTVLWEHVFDGYPIAQPAATANGEILINGGQSGGIRRLALANGPNGWSIDERWTSKGIKPYFNDFVVHEGYAYGFDGSIIAVIDLETGERKWKGGRYGQGQLVLLPKQDLLLILSEKGEVALVSATPDGFNQLAKVPAIEGKTWNHPVVVGDLLLVRNDQEMAAFRLARATG